MRKFLWLAIAVVLVVGLWSAGWLLAAGEVKRQVDLLAQGDGETNPKITCGTLNVSGFPFRIDAECIDGQLVDRDLTVSAKGLRASLLVYNPTHLLISAQAPIAYADAFSGSQRRLDFSALQGSARLINADILKGLGGEGWRIGRVSVTADNATWTDTTAVDFLEAKATTLEAHLVDNPAQFDQAAQTAGLALFVKATGLDLPPLQVAGGELSLEAEIDKLPDDIRAFGDVDLLRRWQAAGGALKITRLAGNQQQPAESFEITGETTLTPNGLLQGGLNYTTRGVLDRFAAVVPPLQLVALKGLPAADGSFTNTLNIVDGRVQLVAFPLFDLPPLF